ncbi:hypothetical protein [Variovorax boronicumulans]|uniref:hypothetical protein n=1 Tax=Variovorax boronicumulans TaxID=436515 RepID=UPI001C55F5AF
MPQTNQRDTLIAAERTPQDYALEHAGYLVDAAERFIAAVCVDAQAALDHDEQDVMETAKAADKAREDSGKHMTSLRAAIHDFRVHRNRALAATAPNAGAPLAGKYFDAFLCRAWGETDLPSAEIVSGWEGVRRFMAREWLGEEGATDDDGEPTLDRFKADFDEHEEDKRGGPYVCEFEIGGVSVERITGWSAAPAQQAGAPLPLAPSEAVAWGIRQKGRTRPHMITLVKKTAEDDMRANERRALHTGLETCFELVHLFDHPTPQQALPLAPSAELMKLSQFAHTAAHMSEDHMRNNLLTIADKLIALATPPQALPLAPSEAPGLASADTKGWLAALSDARYAAKANGNSWLVTKLAELHVALATLPASEAEMRAILQELHDKFNTRVYGTGSYIKRDMRDRIASILNATRAQPQADAAEPVPFAARAMQRMRDMDDAARYRMVRRGQHWSVIDGAGNDLRAEALDAAVNAVIAAQAPGPRGEQA